MCCASRRIFVALVAVVLLGSPSLAAANTSHTQALTQAGLRPLNPSPAPPFTLEEIGGDTLSLESYRGRWVLLTFFATWCGPCVSEMPSLQALHAALQPKGFEVLTVATDSTKEKLLAFAQKRALTFPIVMDNGKIAAAYQASSIPLSYLVDPRGNLVGISRGAKDWRQAIDGLSALLGGNVPAAPPIAQRDHTVELPPDFQPPTATVKVAASPQVNSPFTLSVFVQWAGKIKDYVLHPPALSLPKQVTQQEVTAHASSASGTQTLRYDFVLQAEAPGDYVLGPLEVRYTPAFEKSPMATRLEGAKVTVAKAALEGSLGAWWPWAGLASVLVIVAWAFYRTTRRRRGQTSVPATAIKEQAQERLGAIKKARMEGEADLAVREIAQLAQELLGREIDASLPDLSTWREKAQYGGQAPPPGAVEAWIRTLEREIERLSPHTEGDLGKVQLKEETP